MILVDLRFARIPWKPWSARPQLRVLLDHLGKIKDTPQSWKVAYPLRGVLFLAQSIPDAEADYLLAVKDNQPALHAASKSYFDTALSGDYLGWLRAFIFSSEFGASLNLATALMS